MDNVEALFIRACKSDSLEYRIKRIYEKVYYDKYDDSHMTYILLGIAEKYNLISNRCLIENLNPREAWKFGCNENNSYYFRTTKLLISAIRLCEVSKLTDYPIPAKFRNN